MTIAQPFLNYDMSETGETKPTPPDDSRLLEVGEIIQDGDLHFNATVKHWVAVTSTASTAAKTLISNGKQTTTDSGHAVTA